MPPGHLKLVIIVDKVGIFLFFRALRNLLSIYLCFPEIGDAGSSLNPSGGSRARKLQTRRQPLAIHASARRIGRSRRGGAIRAVGAPNGVGSEIGFLLLTAKPTPPRATSLRRGSLTARHPFVVCHKIPAFAPRIARSRRGGAIRALGPWRPVGKPVPLANRSPNAAPHRDTPAPWNSDGSPFLCGFAQNPLLRPTDS